MRSLRPGARARSLGWNLGDQVLSSVTNVALTVIVARSVSGTEFGGFALAITVYILAVLVVRAICGQPLLLAHAAASGVLAQRRVTEEALGLGLAFGLGASALGLVAAASTSGSLQRALLPLGVLLVPLVLQDVCRYVAFAQGKPRRAFGNDLLWTVGQGVSMGVVIAAGHASVASLVWAWGLAGTVAGALALGVTAAVPRVKAGLRFFWVNRGLCGRFMGEVLITSGAVQVTLVGVAFISGPIDVGALRGAPVLFGPLNLLFAASLTGLLAEMAHVAHEGPDRLRSQCRLISVGALVVSAGYGAVLVFLPAAAGRAALGDTWHLTDPLLVPFAVQYAAVGVCLGEVVGLRALASAHRSFGVCWRFTVLFLVFGIGGEWRWGAPGAAWGMAVAAVLAITDWHIQFRRALGEGVQAIKQDRPVTIVPTIINPGGLPTPADVGPA